MLYFFVKFANKYSNKYSNKTRFYTEINANKTNKQLLNQ